jgi:hypothetical protein
MPSGWQGRGPRPRWLAHRPLALVSIVCWQAACEAWSNIDIDASSVHWAISSRIVGYVLFASTLALWWRSWAKGRHAETALWFALAMFIGSKNVQRTEFLTRADPGDHGFLGHPFGLHERWLATPGPPLDEELLFWRWDS